jgi:hypothetical protein
MEYWAQNMVWAHGDHESDVSVRPTCQSQVPSRERLFGDFNRHGGLFGHNSDRPVLCIRDA